MATKFSRIEERHESSGRNSTNELSRINKNKSKCRHSEVKI